MTCVFIVIYVIKFVRDLWQGGGFLWVIQFPQVNPVQQEIFVFDYCNNTKFRHILRQLYGVIWDPKRWLLDNKQEFWLTYIKII
jgi:hypothetical protein